MCKIAFPQMANYRVPAKYLFTHITNCEIIDTPNITSKTIELGNKYSPEFICTPFKYTLGSLLESIELGADTLIQMGGGCRYGYYYTLQEEIIKNLGYDVDFYNLVTAGKTNILYIYKMLKEIEPNLKIFKSLYYLSITVKMVKYMDKIDDYIRQNIGFEEVSGSFIKLRNEMLEEFSKSKSNLDLYFKYKKYFKKIKSIKVIKKDTLKVGIIGELYTVMEPFSNFYLEEELAKRNIEIKRFTNVDYLLFTKKKEIKKAMKNSKYMKYKLVADASNNIYWAEYLARNNYNGIIHIKSAFCTPEIAIMPTLNKIANELDIPIMFISFDINTSEVGIKTRIEAFVDMIEMRVKKCI